MVFSALSKINKIRRVVAIATLVAGVTSGAFVAVAFTGRTPDDFTISLRQEAVRLAIDEDEKMSNPTTFLKLEKYPKFTATTFSQIMSKGDLLDNESTNHKKIGIVEHSTDDSKDLTMFFKHTFYIKNLGSAYANFEFTVNITNYDKPAFREHGYDDYLRVMVFENDADSDKHNYEVYAKKAEYKDASEIPLDENKNQIWNEPIAGDPSDDDFPGFATKFKSDTAICERQVLSFAPQDVMRYTVVVWFEGTDRQCGGKAPESGDLQLGVKINGQQQADEESSSSSE